MRVIALHNAAAGSQDHDREELAEQLQRCGHEVVRVVRHHHELERALREEGCDLIVVAGGDGTVNKAARAARGTTIPIAILPRGTANNVARSLGVGGDTTKLMTAWPELAPRGLDAATATWSIEIADAASAPLARRHVFECFGYGAFCRAMEAASAAHHAAPAGGAEEKLARDRLALRESVATAPVREYRIEVDGVDRSGAYLMVELMLIPLLGPRVELAPEARRNDGKLDVVLVTDAEREGLLRHLADEGSATRPLSWRADAVRGSSVIIDADDAQAHADGELCEGEDGERLFGPVRIDVTASAYQVLAPTAEIR